MNLKKDIEILTELSLYNLRDKHPDAFDALKLGIEAIKRCEQFRQGTSHNLYVPLQGETDE